MFIKRKKKSPLNADLNIKKKKTNKHQKKGHLTLIDAALTPEPTSFDKT